MSINKKFNEDFYKTKKKHKQNRSDRKLITNKLIKNLIITFIFIAISNLLYVKCENRIENNKRKDKQKSSFNLEKDYAEFQTKMTEQDTIKVWTVITSCMYQVVEKLTITKKGSYITISPEIKESLIEDMKFKKQKPIIISENDTIWKFGEFMKKYNNRITTEKDSIGRFYIKCNSRKFHFTTKRWDNEFLLDYCTVMKHIYPNSKYHFFEKIEIVK